MPIPKKLDKPKKEIYLLRATYKDNDPETIGAYNSMRSMMRGFAKSIVDDVLGMSFENNGRVKLKDVHEVAKALADLIPAFFDHDYPRDDEGCISYGGTTYGYETMEVESVEEGNEEQEEQED